MSSDIQNLAADAAENADQVKDIIKSIQDEIIVMSNELSDIVAAGMEEVKKSQVAANQLALLIEEVTHLVESNEKVKDYSHDVMNSITEAKQAAEEIAAAAEESAAAVEEATRSAETQLKALEELAAAAEEIASIADELQNF